ncbi:hypothetical protein FN846DRAFT_491438 [Sphaerosporella brunnea]|uniref:Uncharacterized protein n=1 Tax=Sphaerosporella brunnea TaxID=1250544 RepID=A0A5J5EEB3_9PEZI|nr:hypothetical protein FN846DRAFT_491438 [Sphaerosporella brunnea]
MMMMLIHADRESGARRKHHDLITVLCWPAFFPPPHQTEKNNEKNLPTAAMEASKGLKCVCSKKCMHTFAIANGGSGLPSADVKRTQTSGECRDISCWTQGFGECTSATCAAGEQYIARLGPSVRPAPYDEKSRGRLASDFRFDEILLPRALVDFDFQRLLWNGGNKSTGAAVDLHFGRPIPRIGDHVSRGRKCYAVRTFFARGYTFLGSCRCGEDGYHKSTKSFDAHMSCTHVICHVMSWPRPALRGADPARST